MSDSVHQRFRVRRAWSTLRRSFSRLRIEDDARYLGRRSSSVVVVAALAVAATSYLAHENNHALGFNQPPRLAGQRLISTFAVSRSALGGGPADVQPRQIAPDFDYDYDDAPRQPPPRGRQDLDEAPQQPPRGRQGAPQRPPPRRQEDVDYDEDGRPPQKGGVPDYDYDVAPQQQPPRGQQGAPQRPPPRRQDDVDYDEDGYTPEWAKPQPKKEGGGFKAFQREARHEDASSLDSFGLGKPIRAFEQAELQEKKRYEERVRDEDEMLGQKPPSGDWKQARNSWDLDDVDDVDTREEKAKKTRPAQVQNPPVKRRKGAPRLTPAMLTAKLKLVNSPEEIAERLMTGMAMFPLNAIHITAAFFKLSDMRRSGQDLAVAFEDDAPCWQEVVRQTGRLLSRQEMRSREISVVLLAIARLRDKVPSLQKELVPLILKAIPDQVHSINERSIADIMWSLSVLDSSGAEAEATTARNVLLPKVSSRLNDFTMQDLAQITWALTSSGVGDQRLLDSIADRVRKQTAQTSTWCALSDLPSLACSFAKLRPWRRFLMEQIAFRVYPVMDRLKRWELAALLWAWEQGPASARGTRQVRPQDKPEDTALAKKKKPSVREVFGFFYDALSREAEARGLSKEQIARSPNGPDESWYEASDAVA